MTAKVRKSLDKVNKKVLVPFADFMLGKIMSKKLMVYFMATLFFIWLDRISSEQWVTVSKWYFGSQGSVDVTKALVSGYNKYKNKTS